MLRFALILALLSPAPAFAQEAVTISVEVVQETPAAAPGGERFVGESRADADSLRAIASFGPFRVIDGTRAALVDTTDTASPRAFAQMLIAYPGLRTILMIECPGTSDDTANLRLGRMIRRAGLDTYVPGGGSVRSGAVELFLAGRHRRAEGGAQFAVHSWQDSDGFEPSDVAENDPVNLAYLAYYREMGLSDQQARAFYAMTNAVPHDEALWLSKDEFAAYARLD
ncbi:MAG: alpha/beta hydrolase [Novosphingobium sp.]|nr:alpha/beta hydrolase [Novosphingobium sp.]